MCQRNPMPSVCLSVRLSVCSEAVSYTSVAVRGNQLKYSALVVWTLMANNKKGNKLNPKGSLNQGIKTLIIAPNSISRNQTGIDCCVPTSTNLIPNCFDWINNDLMFDKIKWFPSKIILNILWWILLNWWLDFETLHYSWFESHLASLFFLNSRSITLNC